MIKKVAFLLLTILILSINVGAVAPELESITITDTGGFTNESTPKISITLAVDSPLPTHMQFSCNGTEWKEWQTYATQTIDFDITTLEYDCLNGEDGAVIVHAKLKNGDENSTVQSDDTHYDATAPTALIVSPADEEWINTISQISGTAADTGGAELARIWIGIENPQGQYWSSNETAWIAEETFNEELDTSWAYVFASPNSNGHYEVKVKATDNADNNSTITTSNFNFDNNRPQLLSAKYISHYKVRLVFTEQITGENVTPVISFGNSMTPTDQEAELIGDTSNGWEMNLFVENGTPSSSTTVNMSGFVDRAGNEMEVAVGVVVLGEDEAPVTTTSFDSTNWQASDISIILTCSDVNWAGCKETFYCIDDTSNDCDALNGIEYTTTQITHAAEGTSYIRFASRDNFGNEEIVKSQILKFDKSISAPSISTSVSDDDVTISWDVVDENSLSGISCYEIRRSASSGFDYAGSGVTTIRSCSSQGESTSYTNLNLGNDTYYYRVKAVDNAGNEAISSQASATVDVTNNDDDDDTDDDDDEDEDNSAPSLEWEKPVTNDRDDVSGTIMLKVWSYDNESNMRYVEFMVDDAPIEIVTSQNLDRYIVNWDSTTVADGEHVLTAVAKNWSGSNNDARTKTITITTNNGIEPEDGTALETDDANKVVAENAIDAASDKKETVDSLLAELDVLGIALDAGQAGLFADASELIDSAQELLEDKNYSQAIEKADEAIAKLEALAELIAVGEYGEGSQYVYNEEHLELLMKELGFSQTVIDEAKAMLEENNVERSLSFKQVGSNGETYYKAVITLTIKNNSGKAQEIKVIEVIPKEFAETASEIVGENFTVIVDDPVLEWVVSLEAGQEATIVYALKSELTAEQADAMVDSEILNKFSIPPVLVSSETEMNKASFLGTTIGLFGLGGTVEIFGIVIILGAIIVFAALYVIGKQGNEKQNSFGLDAATKRAGFGSSFFDKIGKSDKKEESSGSKWKYSD